MSYLCMGECIGFADLLAAWADTEREFARRVYRTLSIDAFVAYGGWGTRPEPFPVRREPDEAPVFHAEIYRTRYLGKIAPAIDLNALIRGEPQAPPSSRCRARKTP